jgi:Tfp pilus tip-associated adhesin PilY1/methionine-rich copper-binding protein CopC
MKKLLILIILLMSCAVGSKSYAGGHWAISSTTPTSGLTITAEPPGSIALTFSEQMGSTAPNITLTGPGAVGSSYTSGVTLSGCSWNSGQTVYTCTTPTGTTNLIGGTYTFALTNASSLTASNHDTNPTSGATSWTFTETAPTWTVNMTSPGNGTTQSTPPSTISLTFSQAMNTSTVNSIPLTVTDENSNSYTTSATPTWNGANTVATWTVSGLTNYHYYTVTLGTGTTNFTQVFDALGGAMTVGSLAPWTFNTDDTVTPTFTTTVSTLTTTNGTNYIKTNQPTITLAFSEVMNITGNNSLPGTGTGASANIYLQSSGGTVINGTGTWSTSRRRFVWTANLTPTGATTSLSDNTVYTLYITNNVQDLAGKAIAAYNISFKTDLTSPVIASVSPPSSATGIGMASSVIVNFTEANSGINLNTLTAPNVTITNNSSGLTVPYILSLNANQLTLSPSGGLDPNTNYTVSLSNTAGQGVTDNAGNTLCCSAAGTVTNCPTNAGPFTGGACSWSFTTQSESTSAYVAYPSFMCSSVKPNVLVILGNSNSFDEDLNNNAIGSSSCANGNCSKSILARQALIQMIQTYSNKMNIGLMSYKQNNASAYYLANNFYFASFDPRSYCPIQYPYSATDQATYTACQNYCINEEPVQYILKSGTCPGTTSPTCTSAAPCTCFGTVTANGSCGNNTCTAASPCECSAWTCSGTNAQTLSGACSGASPYYCPGTTTPACTTAAPCTCSPYTLPMTITSGTCPGTTSPVCTAASPCTCTSCPYNTSLTCTAASPCVCSPSGKSMSANQTACYSGCSVGNPLFASNYRDAITTTNGAGGVAGSAENSAERINYCSLVYPKTFNYINGSGNGKVNVYHQMPGTFYDSSNPGISYVYPNGTYNTGQYPTYTTNYWYNCPTHTASSSGGAGDSYSFISGCTSNGGFAPTDEDESSGFFNFGQLQFWYYTSPTWFNNAAPGGGFLNVQINSNDPLPSDTLYNVQQNTLLGYLGYPGLTVGLTNSATLTQGFQNDSADYMSCGSAGASPGSCSQNSCHYIFNSGWTATEGALRSAISYFNGTLTSSNGFAPQTGMPALAASNFVSPIKYPCQQNYIVYVTDGDASVDPSGNGNTATNLMPGVLSAIDGLACPPSSQQVQGKTYCSVNLNLNGNNSTFNVPVYVLGMGRTASASQNINNMAIESGTDVNGKAYQGDTANDFNNSLSTIFNNIMLRTASGTAASILNNSLGSGANILQAMFYPSQLFGTDPTSLNLGQTQAYWIGEMQALWYYIDPTLNNPTIREDTNHDNILELNLDNIIQYSYNATLGQTSVGVYTDSSGTNVPSTNPITTESPSYVNTIWSAGLQLWSRNLTQDPRLIYTGFNSTPGSTPTLFNTSTIGGLSAAQSLLQVSSNNTANDLITYISGTDPAGNLGSDGTQYRPRKVTWLGLSKNSCVPATADSSGETCTREWKLGDIVSSTPKLVSNNPLASYNNQPPNGYSDTSYSAFTSSNTYKNRGMVFVGANDGMLHAFKLGILQEDSGSTVKAQINDPTTGNVATSSTNLGREEWAFIPQNALPYLSYYARPTYDHMYFVDRPVTIVDASIGTPAGCSGDYSSCTKSIDGSTWRTVLIGGMGMGGATRLPPNQTCNSMPSSYPGIPSCIYSPVTNGGLSSYFALDVTDPENPKYMWEFNDSLFGDMGASTTGPIVVRLAYRNSGYAVPNTNGKFYAIFASGPTGPIDTNNHIFLGQSDQNLKIFIVDLATGALVQTIDSGIPYAFAGNLTTASIDTDRWNPSASGNYSDDVVYIGYSQLDTTVSPPTWTKGGVLRLTTSDLPCVSSSTNTQCSSLPCSITCGTNPANGLPAWNLSTLISGTGPVTSSITKLQDISNNNLWIYFGTGRFFYSGDDPSAAAEKIYAVKDPCYSTANRNIAGFSTVAGGTNNHMDGTCNASATNATGASGNVLIDQSGSSTTPPSMTLPGTAPGWVVTLDAAGTGSLTERIISDPTASANGVVFFTSYIPNSSPCAFGGNTYVWALNYNSGAQPKASAMQGKALVQVSTGTLSQLSLSSVFSSTNQRYNGRRSSISMSGAPPISQGLSLIKLPFPINKVMHYMEK